jgi:hypothetical protein
VSNRKPFPYAAGKLLDSANMDLSDVARIVVKIGKRQDIPADVHCIVLELLLKVQGATEKIKTVRSMRPKE